MCCAICPARTLPVFVWRRWFLRDGKPNAQFCFIQSCIACVMFIIESLKRVSAEWFHASLLLLASDASAKRGQQLMFNFALDIAGRCCFVLALRATSSRVEPLFAYNFLFSFFLFFSLPFSCLCRMPPKFDPSAVSYVCLRAIGGEVGATAALAPKIGPLGLVSELSPRFQYKIPFCPNPSPSPQC